MLFWKPIHAGDSYPTPPPPRDWTIFQKPIFESDRLDTRDNYYPSPRIEQQPAPGYVEPTADLRGRLEAMFV